MLVSEVKVSAVEVDDVEIIFGESAVRDAEDNAIAINDAASGDPTILVALGDPTNVTCGELEGPTFTVVLSDPAVIVALGDPAVIVALGDATNVELGTLDGAAFTVALGDTTAEIWPKARVIKRTILKH